MAKPTPADVGKNILYGIFPYLGLMDWGIKKLSGPASQLWNGLTGQTSAQATKEANERNIQNQNYWNEITMQREDTAHQREVADLQAAGLNPWLSAGGNGASTVSLETAQAEPEDGSKVLQATSAMALLALTKLLLKKI